MFNNVYGRNGSYVTAGQQDYAERMNQIQTQKEAYYKKVGVAPGVPTEKGAYGDPENTGVGYNAVLTELGNHDVPQGWIQTPHPNTTPGTNPGAPVSWNDPSNPDDPQAGYGYIPNDTTKEETFFYHCDHLGSTSYITDDKANITQYDAYLPYGELLVDEHSSSEDLPYKFNGKQFDEETGMYYYGARYYDPRLSLWMSVDRFAEKYPATSGYNYAINNPVRYIDINGDSIRVSSENRELFNKTLKDVFGEFSSKFSYTQSDMLVFSGENKGMGKAQRKVFKRLKKVMYSKTITNIQYGKDTQITDRYGNKSSSKAESGGGAATLLASENENYNQNFIVIDPNKTIGETMEVTDAYYKEPIDPQNGARFKKVTFQTNQTDLTFHEIGYVVYEGKGQHKVLDFNNIVRGILQLPKRQYDETHNYKVRK